MKSELTCAILDGHDPTDAFKRMKITAIEKSFLRKIDFVPFSSLTGSADCVIIDHLFSIEKSEDGLRQFKINYPHATVMAFLSDFNHEALREMRRFDDLISVYVVPTIEMQVRMSSFFDTEVAVIADPIDFHMDTSFSKTHVKKETMDILWFGDRESFDRSMLEFSPLLEWMHATQRIRYHIITDVTRFGHRENAIVNQYAFETFANILSNFDLCILSDTPNDFRMSTYSNSYNKAILSINRGVPVIASRTPSYERLFAECELSDFLFISRKQLGNCMEILENPEERNLYLSKSQGIVLKKYGPHQVANDWFDLYSKYRDAS